MQTLSGFHFVKALLYTFITEKRLKYLRVNVRKALHCILFSFIINLFNRHPIFVQMKEDAHVDRY